MKGCWGLEEGLLVEIEILECCGESGESQNGDEGG